MLGRYGLSHYHPWKRDGEKCLTAPTLLLRCSKVVPRRRRRRGSFVKILTTCLSRRYEYDDSRGGPMKGIWEMRHTPSFGFFKNGTLRSLLRTGQRILPPSRVRKYNSTGKSPRGANLGYVVTTWKFASQKILLRKISCLSLRVVAHYHVKKLHQAIEK